MRPLLLVTMFRCIPAPSAPTLDVIGPVEPGSTASVVVSHMTPGSEVLVYASETRGTDCPPLLGGLCVDLETPRAVMRGTADNLGYLRGSITLPDTEQPSTVRYLQAASTTGSFAETSEVIVKYGGEVNVEISVLWLEPPRIGAEAQLLREWTTAGGDLLCSLREVIQAESSSPSLCPYCDFEWELVPRSSSAANGIFGVGCHRLTGLHMGPPQPVYTEFYSYDWGATSAPITCAHARAADPTTDCVNEYAYMGAYGEISYAGGGDDVADLPLTWRLDLIHRYE